MVEDDISGGSMKARLLYDDKIDRWKKGEIGIVLENNFPEKYDYFLELPGTYDFPELGIYECLRQYYFRKGEIELMPEPKQYIAIAEWIDPNDGPALAYSILIDAPDKEVALEKMKALVDQEAYNYLRFKLRPCAYVLWTDEEVKLTIEDDGTFMIDDADAEQILHNFHHGELELTWENLIWHINDYCKGETNEQND